MTSTRVTCLGCSRPFGLGIRVKKGRWLACPHCGAGLEVICVNPPMLTWASDGLRLKRRGNWLVRNEAED